MRALIVGAGVSGFLHALALRSAGVRIRAIFDPDHERAELLASLVGGTATSSFVTAQELEVDVCAVCSPPLFHVEQAEALARPHRLLFVEKPIATSEPGLERLRSLPNVVPVLQWRAGRSARRLRALVRDGAFGASPRVDFDLRLWRDEDYYAHGRRGRAAWGCGAMLSIGIHAIDLLLWIVGRRVVGAAGREWLGRPHVDVATGGELVVLFEGGARAELRVTVDAAGSDNAVRLAVSGGSASAELIARESDPTACALVLDGIAPNAQVHAGGAAGSPLLVPFVREAIAAFARGRATVSVEDVVQAHALALGVESKCTGLHLERSSRPHERRRAQ